MIEACEGVDGAKEEVERVYEEEARWEREVFDVVCFDRCRSQNVLIPRQASYAQPLSDLSLRHYQAAKIF